MSCECHRFVQLDVCMLLPTGMCGVQLYTACRVFPACVCIVLLTVFNILCPCAHGPSRSRDVAERRITGSCMCMPVFERVACDEFEVFCMITHA